MSFDTWIAFTIGSGFVLFVPGPSVLVIVSYSIAHGKPATVCLILAVMLGNIVSFMLSVVGVGGLLASSSLWFNLFNWIAGIYLLALAVRLFQKKHTDVIVDLRSATLSRWKLLCSTCFITALSPTTIVFNMTILPKFISLNKPLQAQYLIFFITVVVLSLLKATAYTFCATRARGRLATPIAMRRCDLINGSLLSVAGVWAIVGG